MSRILDLSTTSGHDKIVDKMTSAPKELEGALTHLRSLPFIQGLHFRQEENDTDQENDGTQN
jgi:hypothetical protein